MRNISGAGLGLRREFIDEVITSGFKPDWFEITPENWIFMPHMYREYFDEIASKFPLVAHGLSLSIGSPEPLNRVFLNDLKAFLDRYSIEHYSEHLSFSSLEGAQTYELLPLPMTQGMIEHVADRIKQAQDILQRPIILENATYYHVALAPLPNWRHVSIPMRIVFQTGNVFVVGFKLGPRTSPLPPQPLFL